MNGTDKPNNNSYIKYGSIHIVEYTLCTSIIKKSDFNVPAMKLQITLRFRLLIIDLYFHYTLVFHSIPNFFLFVGKLLFIEIGDLTQLEFVKKRLFFQLGCPSVELHQFPKGTFKLKFILPIYRFVIIYFDWNCLSMNRETVYPSLTQRIVVSS